MNTRVAALLLTFMLAQAAHAEPLRMLVWNVESGGSDPDVIAAALTKFDGYHLFGLSEVSRSDFTRYRDAVAADEESYFRYIGTITGGEDRLLFIYDTRRLSLNGFSELFNHRGTPLNDGRWRHRSPPGAPTAGVRTSSPWARWAPGRCGPADAASPRAAAMGRYADIAGRGDWRSELRL